MKLLTFMLTVFLISTLTLTASACGGNFTSSSGTLYSPNHIGVYPPSQNCVYTISVSTGSKLFLTFLNFHLDSGCCGCAFLEVRDGCYSTSTLVAKYCGRYLPANIRSSGSCLYLRFVYDSAHKNSGFQINYETKVSNENYVSFSCSTGYSVIGDTTYSPSVWICQADCARLPRPKNGILSSTVVKHGSSVTVSCNSGYTLSGERILVCSSGSWSDRIGTCEADCVNLQRPTNGYLSAVDVKHGSSLTVSCNSGYTLLGERTLVCLSGSLSGTIGTCERDCKNLRRPTSGYLSSTVVKHGSSVTVSCNSGYTLSGERILGCSSGSLSGRIGTCEADCATLRSPADGSLSSTVVKHGSSVTVSCNSGYTLSGERTLVCLSGSWSGRIGTCEPDCGNLQKPTNGFLSSPVVKHGSSVTVSCKSDYTLSGERTLVCSSGFLSGRIGTCEADCVGLVAPEHAIFSTTNINHGDLVSVSCQNGYTLVGDRTLHCFSGVLAGNIGTCYADCLGLVAPEHGLLSNTYISHADFVSVSCLDEYTLVGDRTLRCFSGSLVGEIGTCYAVCNGLVAPANGSLSSTNVTHGNFVIVSCDVGYQLEGNQTLVCSSGSLLGHIGTCVEDDGRATTLVDRTNNSEVFTIIVVAAPSGFVIIALLGIVVLQRVCSKRTKGSDHGRIRMTEIQDPETQSQNAYSEIHSSTLNGKPTERFAATDNLDCPSIPPRSKQKCEAGKLEEEKYTNLTAKMNLNALSEYEQLKNSERYSVAQQPMQEDDEPENTYVNLQLRW